METLGVTDSSRRFYAGFTASSLTQPIGTVPATYTLNLHDVAIMKQKVVDMQSSLAKRPSLDEEGKHLIEIDAIFLDQCYHYSTLPLYSLSDVSLIASTGGEECHVELMSLPSSEKLYITVENTFRLRCSSIGAEVDFDIHDSSASTTTRLPTSLPLESLVIASGPELIEVAIEGADLDAGTMTQRGYAGNLYQFKVTVH